MGFLRFPSYNNDTTGHRGEPRHRLHSRNSQLTTVVNLEFHKNLMASHFSGHFTTSSCSSLTSWCFKKENLPVSVVLICVFGFDASFSLWCYFVGKGPLPWCYTWQHGGSEKILGQNCPSAKNTGSCEQILNIEGEVEERRTVASRERRTVASREPKREQITFHMIAPPFRLACTDPVMCWKSGTLVFQ